MAEMERINGLALCAGVSGLELGLHIALGERYRTVGYCEREAFAASVVVARMEEKALDEAPIWDDLRTFPCELYRGKVDIITAGFPCPPVSCAGKRLGTADPRWLWAEVQRILGEVRPGLCFLENVPGLVSDRTAFGDVLRGLAEVGYSAEWDCFPASAVGASHRRERVFILAYLRGDGCGEAERNIGGVASAQRSEESSQPEPRRVASSADDGGYQLAYSIGSGTGSLTGAIGGRERTQGIRQGDGAAGAVRADAVRADAADGDVADAKRPQSRAGDCREQSEATGHWRDRLADAGGALADAPIPGGRWDGPQRGSDRRAPAGRTGETVADAERAECGRANHEPYEHEAGRDEGTGGLGGFRIPLFPPGPGDLDAWRKVLAIDPTLEPAICRVADGLAGELDGCRADRLRACGNGVVALQAALAFAVLADRTRGRE